MVPARWWLILSVLVTVPAVQGCRYDTVIRTKVNKSFEIKLDACHTCGYSWFLAPMDTTKIQHLGTTSEPKIKVPELVGGNAIETWSFIGLKKGTQVLEFYYKRPWLQEIHSRKKIKVIIK